MSQKNQGSLPKSDLAEGATYVARETALVMAQHKAQALEIQQIADELQDLIQVDTMVLPTIKILQDLSAEAKGRDALGRPGDLFHNILQEVVPAPLAIIPLLMRSTSVIWRPMVEGGGMIARSLDGVTWDKPNEEFMLGKERYNTGSTVRASGLTEWNPKFPDGKPIADESLVMFALLKDNSELGPTRFFFRSTSLKNTKLFVQSLQMRAGMLKKSPYAFQVTLGVREESKGPNKWFVPSFNGLKAIEDLDLVEQAKKVLELYGPQMRNNVIIEQDAPVENSFVDDGQPAEF